MTTETTEINEDKKPRLKKDYFVCSEVLASFESRRECLVYLLQENLQESNATVIWGTKKTISREQIPVVNIL